MHPRTPIGRRLSVLGSGLGGLALAALALSTVAVPGRVRATGADRILVASGEVTPTAAVVWVRGRRAGTVTVELSGPPGEAVRRVPVVVTHEGDFTGKAALTGLRPATRYRYRVEQGGLTAAGELVTAPPPAEPARVTFLWSGDLGGGGSCRLIDGGYRIFRAMARHPADFFLFVGDTIYADIPCNKPGTVRGAGFVARTLDEFRVRHRYNREDPAVQAFLRATPVLAIWDDHEVRNDFAGPTEPLMPAGRQAFIDYWPITPPADDPTRLYRQLRWGALLELFILDTRQYRSPNTELDGPGKTMLGLVQRRWLLDQVAASTATWKVVVSSVPLALPTGRRGTRDSWSNASVLGTPDDDPTGFTTERDTILRELRLRGVRNLIVVTADVHHAELIRHHPHPEFSFHEFIAGPLSATLGRPRALDQALGSRSLFARGGIFNFGEVTIEPALLTVRLLDEDGQVMFTHTIGPE